MTNYIGLDHHRKFTQVAVVDEVDAVVLECKMPNTLEAVDRMLERLKGPIKAVVEAGPSWGWIFDMARTHAGSTEKSDSKTSRSSACGHSRLQ